MKWDLTHTDMDLHRGWVGWVLGVGSGVLLNLTDGKDGLDGILNQIEVLPVLPLGGHFNGEYPPRVFSTEKPKILRPLIFSLINLTPLIYFT